MRKHLRKLSLVAIALSVALSGFAQKYQPTEDNLAARQKFEDSRFGIFLHWGIYSMFAQGEWYLNRDLKHEEYKKAASGFYPANFDAKAWVSAIKASGAKYICFTSRHHDGFSMFGTKQSDYNIVDATPFKRDIIKELADECHRQGIELHLYYSHIDWGRDDYPKGRTGLHTGCDRTKEDWPHYYKFMNSQLTELLTNYGKIGAIWFDGMWDHDSDPTPFNWQLEEQYALIHRLQPDCLVANNHHLTPFDGEDFQIFERDLPGENTAGLSGQSVSHLPLETCQTMNGMWGYKIADQNYKTVDELIKYLVGTAGKGANLLMNIGPQPNGELPAIALNRLKGMGEWLQKYGETIYGTTAGDVAVQDWGVTTRKGDRLFVHIFNKDLKSLYLPISCKVKVAKEFLSGVTVKFEQWKHGVQLQLPQGIDTNGPDLVIELTTKN